MALTPPQTMLVWALSGDLWFGRRELLQPVLNLGTKWTTPYNYPIGNRNTVRYVRPDYPSGFLPLGSSLSSFWDLQDLPATLPIGFCWLQPTLPALLFAFLYA